MASAADLRELMGWPDTVPAPILERHLAGALRELQRDTALTDPPDGGADDWRDAQCWKAAEMALPVLHTFALSGAAKVGRLEGAVEWRFLTAEESGALATRCGDQYRRLVDKLRPAVTPDAVEPVSEITVGGIFYAAL